MHDRDEDPSDRIVGTWHAPAWVRRVPPMAWPFIGLALLAAVLRATDSVGNPLLPGADPVQAAHVVARVVRASVLVALPAAVLVGAGRRPLPSLLLSGAVALAAGELIGSGADRLRIQTADGGQGGVLAVSLVTAVLAIVGPAAIGLGVRRAAPTFAFASGAARAVIAVTAIAVVVQLALTWLAVMIAGGVGSRFGGFVVIAGIGSVGALIAWGWFAAVAAAAAAGGPEGPAESRWFLLEVGALAVLGAQLVSVALPLVALGSPVTQGDAQPGRYLVGLAAAAVLSAAGWLVLAIAMASGIGRARPPFARSVKPEPEPARRPAAG